MKSPARVFVIWAFAASIVLSAQSRAIPAPDATFGFRPGADFKLATYDQSIAVFSQARSLERVHPARRDRQDEPGAPDVLRPHLEPEEPTLRAFLMGGV